jgi:large subunit ribosomal protein L17
MRHRVAKVKLNRDMAHRKALLKNMSASLIEHEKIETTLIKAKSLRPYVEKLVTKAKRGSDFNTLRYLRKKLFSEDAIKKLVDDIAPKFKGRKGGYTRIVRVRNRDGDNSVMAVIEFVQVKQSKKDKPESEKAETKPKVEKKEPTKDKKPSVKKVETDDEKKKTTKKKSVKKETPKAKEEKKETKKVVEKKDEK